MLSDTNTTMRHTVGTPETTEMFAFIGPNRCYRDKSNDNIQFLQIIKY